MREGVLLDGLAAQWRVTGDGRLFQYIQAAVDRSVDADGAIHLDEGAAFPVGAHSLDDIEMGRSVLLLYRVLQQPRYYTAAKFLHDQMQQQPKNADGGYWHKGVYPNQMWLDGGRIWPSRFWRAMRGRFDHPAELDAVASQMLLMDTKLAGAAGRAVAARLRCDEADGVGRTRRRGRAPRSGRARVGWYAMALVDVLERMPVSNPQRAALEGSGAAAAYRGRPHAGCGERPLVAGDGQGQARAATFRRPRPAACLSMRWPRGIRLGVLPQRYG